MRIGHPHQQVELAIPVDILEAQRDRDALLPLAEQDGATVDYNGPRNLGTERG
jgi:hypothetical protein